MRLSLEEITQLLARHDSSSELYYLDDIIIRGHRFTTGLQIEAGHIDILRHNGFTAIEVMYNAVMYDFLSLEFPCRFRRPYGEMSFMDMDRYLEELSKVNNATKRKRYISMVGDIYTGSEENPEVLVRHGEPLDYKKWNVIKRELNRDGTFCYRNSEVAIIVFVNLNAESSTSYVERFKKNTDLITAMVSRKKDSSYHIAEDFIPTEDVISVTDPAELLTTYCETQARLIIIGENPDEEYRQSLKKVQNEDRYVRMMVVPAINHANLDHFFKQVGLVYNSNRWE